MPKPLNIVHVAAECAPYAKSGGLGDVVQQLPRALVQDGHHVSVFIPCHGSVKRQDFPCEIVIDGLTVDVRGEAYPVTLKKITTQDHGAPDVYLVCNEELFGKRSRLYGFEDDGLRFLFFDVAVLACIRELVSRSIGGFTQPDILHCHDWHAGLIPQLVRRSIPTLFTIHNLAFQGPPSWGDVPKGQHLDDGHSDPLAGKVKPQHLNFVRRGIMHADAVNTVSERYAAEIMTREFGAGLDRLLRANRAKVHGIINGIDYSVFNPKFDSHVYVNYDTDSLDLKAENKALLQREVGLDVNSELPIIGMVNRLTEQKGFELIVQAFPTLIELPVQLVVVGNGDRGYINFFRRAARKYPKKVGVYSPYTDEMASKVYAGSDMYLMPSRFEPCGLSQLISLRYGSVPIVHSTGGLHDTVTDFSYRDDTGNGFAFSEYAAADLLVAIARALEVYQNGVAWHRLVVRGMDQTFSWELPARKYVELYRRVLTIVQIDNRKYTVGS